MQSGRVIRGMARAIGNMIVHHKCIVDGPNIQGPYSFCLCQGVPDIFPKNLTVSLTRLTQSELLQYLGTPDPPPADDQAENPNDKATQTSEECSTQTTMDCSTQTTKECGTQTTMQVFTQSPSKKSSIIVYYDYNKPVADKKAPEEADGALSILNFGPPIPIIEPATETVPEDIFEKTPPKSNIIQKKSYI